MENYVQNIGVGLSAAFPYPDTLPYRNNNTSTNASFCLCEFLQQLLRHLVSPLNSIQFNCHFAIGNLHHCVRLLSDPNEYSDVACSDVLKCAFINVPWAV
jgi:hypothetical protein